MRGWRLPHVGETAVNRALPPWSHEPTAARPVPTGDLFTLVAPLRAAAAVGGMDVHHAPVALGAAADRPAVRAGALGATGGRCSGTVSAHTVRPRLLRQHHKPRSVSPLGGPLADRAVAGDADGHRGRCVRCHGLAVGDGRRARRDSDRASSGSGPLPTVRPRALGRRTARACAVGRPHRHRGPARRIDHHGRHPSAQPVRRRTADRAGGAHGTVAGAHPHRAGTARLDRARAHRGRPAGGGGARRG